MKKVFKGIAILAATAALGTGVAFAAGCNPTEADNGVKGEAYSLTHGSERFVGYATITVKDNKVVDATLTEVSLPSQISDSDGAKYVEVSYGEVTITLDGEAYKVEDKTLTEYYFGNEVNCKAYYEAAIGGKISAKKADGTVVSLTSTELSKETNGYWTRMKDENGEYKDHLEEGTDPYSRWKWNRDATIAYVKANGVEGLKSLTKTYEGTDRDGVDVNMWEDANGISTGATWNDLYKATAPTNYTTYAQLLLNAYDVATK